ncbi:hypothetical protein [Streptomyces sp. NPDC002133]|uniref:hypothetical protein n=1 Tax=Streptomyces sp. NPDC002133 TaxID=3154409 RepID=UPI00332FA2B1
MADLRLAVVPMLAPTAPRLTHLTRSFIELGFRSVKDFYIKQSGDRAKWSYQVFDWYRMPISQEEFQKLGAGLGDRALPLLARDIHLDASQFTNFVFILDHEGVGPSAAWMGNGDRYLHFGAPSFSPSILAHEIGHRFGLGHSNSNFFPKPPVEYGDPFCIMGPSGDYAYAERTLSFRADFGDPDWFLCTQCGVTFRGRSSDVSVCPGAPPGMVGHSADLATNYNPRHEPPTPASDEEWSWHLCGKCCALFHQSTQGTGQCPAGGIHQTSADGTPSLILRYDSPPIAVEKGNWRQCSKCRSLYLTEAAHSICTVPVPATGHQPTVGGHAYVLPFDGTHNQSGPGLSAPKLEMAEWLDPRVHGIDIGAPLRNRPGSAEVELTWLRGAPLAGSVQGSLYAFADDLAADRVYFEYRSAFADDAGLPQSSPGRSGWVLVHVKLPGARSQLLAKCAAVPGAGAYVHFADLNVRVTAALPLSNRVTLNVTSLARKGWPPPKLVSQTTLHELSEVRPAIVSGTSYVALAWTGTDDQLNAAVSTDGGRTFAPKMHPVQQSADPPALAGADLYIAWAGSDDRLNVGELFGVFAMGQPATLDETSDFGPAITRDRHGTLFLAWTGEDKALNVIMSTDDGWTWTDKRTFDRTSDDRPALAADPCMDRMFLAWRSGEDLYASELMLTVNSAIPEGNPGRCTLDTYSPLGELYTTHELSHHAPSLTVHGHRFYLGWTGTDETLNVAGPMFGPAPPVKRVLDPERSEDGIDLTSHGDTILVGWTGTDETLNVGILDMVPGGRFLDDFRTGVTHMVVPPRATGATSKAGSMIGGSRRVSARNMHSTANVEVDLWAMFDRGLEVQLTSNHSATLTIVYGPADGAVGPALGLDLTQGGADRLRINISQFSGAGVNVNAWLLTKGKISAATVLTGVPGPVDFPFTRFSVDQLTNVDRLVFVFDVFRSTGSSPALVIDSIETRGPADA